MKLNKKDRKVIEAFLNKESADGRQLATDGTRLDGQWMGGRGIAEWKGSKVVCNDLGSRAAQTVQRAVRNVAPSIVEE